jgi:hypothetical protein
MWRTTVSTALLLLCVPSSANAASFSLNESVKGNGTLVQRVHSIYEAEDTLRRRGYYDVRLERASLPYSFNACKRGLRYHIHVDYYGDLVQVDPIGNCGEADYGYYGRRPYYGRYRDRYSD